MQKEWRYIPQEKEMMLFVALCILFLFVIQLKEMNNVGRVEKLMEIQSPIPWCHGPAFVLVFWKPTGAASPA